MSFDPHANFAYSTVATAPSPASSGTSLVVQAGDGSKFPSASFNATVWPSGTQPTTANAEIVRVTNISTDTFTITRSQESTSARSIIVGDQIAATITIKTVTDIEGLFPAGTVVGTTDTQTLTHKTITDTTNSVSFATFTNPYKFSVYRNSAWTTPNSTNAKVQFDTKTFDTGSNYDATTNYRFTAPVAGFYFFTTTVGYGSGSTNAAAYLYKNGSIQQQGVQLYNSGSGTASLGVTTTGLLQLSANDYIEVYIYTNSAFTGNTGADKTYFHGFFLSPA